MARDPFSEALESARGLPCAFERALLRRCVGCHRMRRVLLAEREAAACTDVAASERCAALRSALRENARFALREPSAASPWPFAKELKAQCGGVLGLRQLLIDDGVDAEPDVDRLLQLALSRYGDVGALPYATLMRSVAAYLPRRASARQGH